MTSTEQDQRSEYIAGLRKIADALEADEALPVPYPGSTISRELSVFAWNREELAAWARVLGNARKEVDESDAGFGFELHGQILGVRVVVYAPRDEVCTRRVVGTRDVTEEVPDPEALASVPKVTVTKTVEDVEWDCHPILSESVSA